MEEENGKASADAAQLPETQADLPKKNVAGAKTSAAETEDAPKVNGVCEKVPKEESSEEDSDEKKMDDQKEGELSEFARVRSRARGK